MMIKIQCIVILVVAAMAACVMVNNDFLEAAFAFVAFVGGVLLMWFCDRYAKEVCNHEL